MNTSAIPAPYELKSSGLFNIEKVVPGSYSTGNLEATSSGSIHLKKNGLSFGKLLTMKSTSSATIALATSFTAQGLEVVCESSSNIQVSNVTLTNGTCNINITNSATVVMYIDFGQVQSITGSVQKASTLVIYAKNAPPNNAVTVDSNSVFTMSGWGS